jgi:hypothetical protein
MTRMFQAVAGLSWATEAPMVCDRAMGKTAHVRELLATNLRFLTALTTTEFDSYAVTLPAAAFDLLDPRDEEHHDDDVAEAAARAAEMGMVRADDDLFVLDLGIVERLDAGTATLGHATEDDHVTVRAMRICREITQQLADGRFASFAAAGRERGLGKGVTVKYLTLRGLSEQQQRDVLDGKASHRTLNELMEVAAIDNRDEQQKAFDELLSAPARPWRGRGSPKAPRRPAKITTPLRVRVVAYFNPQRFVRERRQARERIARIEALVDQLNAKAASAAARHTERSMFAAIDQVLRKEALLDAFDVQLSKRSIGATRTSLFLELTLRQAKWARRRRYDGFVVLVAHPELLHNATALCRLYRAKDAVEKDFQVIKSVVELRPIRHRTDGKVRAHVTLCMLALLLERTLQRRLAGKTSAEAALEALESCRLNRFAGGKGPGVYTITQPNAQQQTILRSLGLRRLADDEEIVDRIEAR